MNERTPPISFGGIESVPDYRDVHLTAALGAPRGLPMRYRATTEQLPIWNQKRIGSCVGHAGGKKKQTQEYYEEIKIIPINPRFIYALAKAEDNLPTEGTYYRLGMKIMQKYGAPPEIPEYTNDCDLSHADYIDTKKIPQKAYTLAKPYAIKSYAMVGSGNQISEEQIMQAIAGGQGALLGVKLGREWWTDKNGAPSYRAEDILPLRPPAAVVSGHAIFADAYEVVEDRLKIWHINSWGQEWAEGGRGWFWFDEYQPFFSEAWSAVDLPNDWLETIKKLPSADTFRHRFNYDFAMGLRGDEVAALQTALMIDGEFSQELYIQLLSEQQLGYYGPITKKAVRDFQYKYKVASIAELLLVAGRRVGEKTRRKLNELFAPKT